MDFLLTSRQTINKKGGLTAMNNKNKLITALLLTSGAAAGTALLNKYIKLTALAKNLLSESQSYCYKWRFGSIHYKKIGTGKPLLMIHDLNTASSGEEWSALVPLLKEDYTLYIIDLLGCGRSEKPDLTYTNFLYVQLINDFIKSEIGRRTNVIATGASSSLVTMTCAYKDDLFDQIMFINPESFASASMIPGKYSKIYKFILDTPIIGTLLYNISAAKDTILRDFTEQYFYNPYSAGQALIDQYYESAHRGQSPKSLYSSIHCSYTKCNIYHSLEKIDNSIYIIGGGAKSGITELLKEYMLCNAAIESSVISETKHLPQLEKPEAVAGTIKMFFH